MIEEERMNKASSQICHWYNLFDTEERLYTINGVRILALLSAVFTLYFWVFRREKYLNTMPKEQHSVCVRLSYRNLNYFFTAVHLRNLLVLLSFEEYFQWIVENTLTADFCNLYGFVETFLSVFEVEMLTHLCIERYVVAKYISKGWPLRQEHYSMYVYLTVFFSSLYCVVPLLGVGGYARDLTCGVCAYNLILPQDWSNLPALIVWVLRSVKPVFFMILMLGWAYQLESKYDTTKQKQADKNLTRVIMGLTALNLLCWMPLSLLKAAILVSQFVYDVVFMPSSILLRWALWIHAMAPLMIMVGRQFVDYLVQHNIYFQSETNSEKIDKENS